MPCRSESQASAFHLIGGELDLGNVPVAAWSYRAVIARHPENRLVHKLSKRERVIHSVEVVSVVRLSVELRIGLRDELLVQPNPVRAANAQAPDVDRSRSVADGATE